MSLRDDPYAELTHRAESAGVDTATYLRRMLKNDAPPLSAHLAGAVPWEEAKKLIEKSQRQIAAGKTHDWAEVKKHFSKKRKATAQ